MNLSKLLWIIAGILAVALVAVTGYLFLGREEVDPKVTQMPVGVEKNDTTKPDETSLDLLSPNGGENFGISKSIIIRYKLSDSFKKQLSSLDKVELYLVDTKNVLIGYIGEANKTAGELNWNTQKLFRNGGLDFSVKQTPAGQYRILIVARKGYDTSNVAKDIGINTIDGFRYSNGKIIDAGTNEVWREQPIASDISTSVFTLVNDVATIPKPTVTASVDTDTFSQFKNITAWVVTEIPISWENYVTFTQKMKDQLRTYPDGQMITMLNLFNSDLVEYKNTVEAVYATLNQNGWKRILESGDGEYFTIYLYEKNKKPLILSVYKYTGGKMGVQIDFLK